MLHALIGVGGRWVGVEESLAPRSVGTPSPSPQSFTPALAGAAESNLVADELMVRDSASLGGCNGYSTSSTRMIRSRARSHSSALSQSAGRFA